jgi:hypothetical protein
MWVRFPPEPHRAAQKAAFLLPVEICLRTGAHKGVLHFLHTTIEFRVMKLYPDDKELAEEY